ncbi:hypothetical protein [Armatimonas sp.]|uniref:hypothetical protein n=1 Tax=Armatimonas sp. TaxID=1872638 RepID=UPI00375347F8
MSRAMLPASQRCPAHQAFAQALCPGGGSAKDAATELYQLLQAAESLYHSTTQDSEQHHAAATLIGHGHIIAYNLEALRELGKGLK